MSVYSITTENVAISRPQCPPDKEPNQVAAHLVVLCPGAPWSALDFGKHVLGRALSLPLVLTWEALAWLVF